MKITILKYDWNQIKYTNTFLIINKYNIHVAQWPEQVFQTKLSENISKINIVKWFTNCVN